MPNSLPLPVTSVWWFRRWFRPETRKPNFILSVLVQTVRVIIILIVTLGFAGLGALIGIAKGYVDTAPELDLAALDSQAQTSFIYDCNGELLTEYKDYVTSETELQLDTTLADDFTLKTNQTMLHRILSCLIDNAAKYTEKGRISIHATQTDNLLQLTVTDTGDGVPAEDAERIFDRFVKLNDFKEGIGLGLPLSRKLAEQLGGKIELDTTYTDGAQFIVTLPISKPAD